MNDYTRIEQDPKYQELVRRRTSLGVSLSLAMFAIYFGFILLVAYAPKFLATPLAGGMTTIGIPIGIFVILSAILLTGLYVLRANSSIDTLTDDIAKEIKP